MRSRRFPETDVSVSAETSKSGRGFQLCREFNQSTSAEASRTRKWTLLHSWAAGISSKSMAWDFEGLLNRTISSVISLHS